MKKLSELLKTVDFEFTSTDVDVTNVDINSLAFDSRNVKEGSLFFALPGTHTTGNAYIPQAVENGAAAVVYEGELGDLRWLSSSKPPAEGDSTDGSFGGFNRLSHRAGNVALVKVSSARRAMAPISAEFFGNPSKRLAVIGVTGTEGKSSTVSFVWQLLRLCGRKAGFISTVQYSLGGEAAANPEHTTTPESPVIQEKLSKMVENGCEFAVIETSSHGLSEKLNRTGNIEFDCGIFMNVTLEHLEFHGTFEQYRNDKANLFRKLDENPHEKLISGKPKKIPSFGIVNLEDPSAEFFIKSTKQSVIGFTTEGKAGRLAAEGTEAKPLPPIPEGIPVLLARNIAAARFGIAFDMSEPNLVDENSRPVKKLVHVRAPVPGAFNAYNLMAAIACVSRITGTPIEEVAAHTEELSSVKGRMTVIDEGQDFELIVDYAHTPSSFETIFPPLRRRCAGKMIALFGSGGERDRKKRPLQGEIAAKFCDTIILTDEDPRGEDPVALLREIAEGALRQGKVFGRDLFITPDRPSAIRQAFNMAGKDDIVLLLGKAHENSIIYKDRAVKYDEIAEARKALAEIFGR